MKPVFDSSAPKKATNLSINSDLLAQARARKINLSATLEEALAQLLRDQARDAWRQKNRKAIDSYNEFVEAHGMFGDDYRTF